MKIGDPNEILGTPNKMYDVAKIKEMIDDAVKARLIWNDLDTGFDIDPKSK
jgi:hypothetical protein